MTRASRILLGFFLLSFALTSLAHPGSAIAVAADGRVWFVDTGGGVFSIERDGKVVRHDGPAFHWFAFDAASRFLKTPWPSMPGAEFRSAGVNPTLVLSSDYPVTIGTDGKFYYAEPGADGRARIVGRDPSGARTVRALLPPIQSRGRNVPWINGLTAAPDGVLYYTENRAVRRIASDGRVSTIAENVDVPQCANVPFDEDVDPIRPMLRGLAVAKDGSIYVAASVCGALLRVDPKGKSTVVLRSESPWSPTAVAVANGEVFVLEYLHTATDDRREWLPRVRKIAANGKVTNLGGSGRQAPH
jgi:sugar lactone lactonase YvrE